MKRSKTVTAVPNVAVTLSETGMLNEQFAEATTGVFAERADTVARKVDAAAQVFAMRAPVRRIAQKGH